MRSLEYFKFEGHRATWHTSDIVTIAGRQNFCYREDQAHVLLPSKTPILYERAMYSPNAPRSLINYRDLRANGIHITTAQVSSTERGKSTKCGAGTPKLKRLLVDAAIPGGSKLKTKLGPGQLAYSMEIPARIQTWHNRLSHLGTTMFRRMIPILAGHTVCPSDPGKIGGCASC